MFYRQCWKCGERWELGTASTCKCPKETTIDWKDYSIPVDKMKTLSIGNIKPNYNMTFHNGGKQVGVLDFNGPEMTFSGDMDESATLFFDLIANAFKARLEQERADEREAISDEWSMCVQSDLEHGVKLLNEQAAKEWFKNYREISKFGAWLEARSKT